MMKSWRTALEVAKDRLLGSLIRLLVIDPWKGLGKSLFLQSSRIMPLVNVELVIRDSEDRIALLWREASQDVMRPGWHLPGGIVRVGEKISERVLKTAREECGIAARSYEIVGLGETVIDRDMPRRHFISLVVEIRQWELAGEPEVNLLFNKEVPSNLITNHRRYREYFGQKSRVASIPLIVDREFEKEMARWH